MNQDQAATWASEADRRKDMHRRKIANFKHSLYMIAHKVFWRTLYLVGVARVYSKMACRFGFYSTFPDGRCMWCGNNHR